MWSQTSFRFADTCGGGFRAVEGAVHKQKLSKDAQRKKLRAWQILCILSQYVTRREIDQVILLLKVAIESNKLPSVRHYIEAFAIRVFLQFPCLVEKHLVPVFQDHSMKAQAISSYISIAANVVLCTSTADLRLDHLQQVLPAICPFMTTYHRSSDAFSQTNDIPSDLVSVPVLHQVFRILNSSRRISTEASSRGEFIRSEDRSSKVLLSRSIGKEILAYGSVPEQDNSEQLQSVLSPETLARSEISTKTSSGSVDLANWSSDSVSTSQKLHPQVRSTFQRLGMTNSDRAYESRDNTSLNTLGLQKYGQGDRQQVCDPQQGLIVIATAQADSSAFAGFARTCEICSPHALPWSQPANPKD